MSSHRMSLGQPPLTRSTSGGDTARGAASELEHDSRRPVVSHRTETTSDDLDSQVNPLHSHKVKVIPQVRKCDITEFKNRFNVVEEGIHAIDVLVSGSFLDQEIRDELKPRQSPAKQPKTSSKLASSNRILPDMLVPMTKSVHALKPDERLVTRIRIQSPAILSILSKIMEESWDEDNRPRTFFRPFSSLIYYSSLMPRHKTHRRG